MRANPKIWLFAVLCGQRSLTWLCWGSTQEDSSDARHQAVPHGLRESIKRSTLADTNEARAWRIYADFAQVLIRQARTLHASARLGVELSNTVYADAPL